VQGVSSNLATAIRTVVIILIAWGIVFATGEVKAINGLSTRTWVMLILSAVATGLSWLCYFRALQIGQASYVSPIDKSSTAMILILSVIFLGEQLTWKSFIGTLLILGGTLVFVL
jgi:transporter family protein